MSSFSSLKTAIQNAIKANGNQEITGNLLQGILLSIVETLGDSAINTLETGLSSEASTRGNADTTLQTNINSEATARQNADTQLNNLITGIKNNIDNGYVYAGIAIPTTTPVSGKVFYIATKAGTYTNLGGLSVTEGITILKYNGTTWSKEQVTYGDGGVFDVTAQNGGETFASLEALLGSDSLSTLIPTAVRKGGMSIKFVHTSDNNYVRYNLLADEFTTDVTKWAVDDNGVYINNSNFIEVKVDANKRLLWGIMKNGNVYYGSGIPKQIMQPIVIINNSLSELQNWKVDKEINKSLIDSIYANGVSYINNPNFLEIKLDYNGRIIQGFLKNGDVYFGNGVPYQIKEYIHQYVSEEIQKEEDKIMGYDDTSDAINTLNEVYDYLKGLPNSFQNKKISILGDSISTFNQEGYMIPGYRMYYPRPIGSTDRSADVRTVDDTWWKKVIDSTNSYFEVNASWSGSCASNRRQSDGFPNFVDRVSVLGNPDLIFIELGSNDSGWGVEIGEIDFNAESYDLSKFAPAYIKGIQTTISTYPKAKIICLAFKMKTSYEDVIKTVANHYKLSFISVGDLCEELHPNKEEMQKIANRIINRSKITLKEDLDSIRELISNINS